MMSRYRLCRDEDFERLRLEGCTYQHRFFTLSVLSNGLTYNRFGFITSKRLGNAVTRNRVRRQLREVIRHLQPHLRIGYDVVIVARRNIVGQPFRVIYRTVDSMMSQADIVEGDVL